MDSARPKNANNLLSLKNAADRLGVSTEVLLNLNEYNILKPTITLSGEIGYTQEQIENFLLIKQLSTKGNNNEGLDSHAQNNVARPEEAVSPYPIYSQTATISLASKPENTLPKSVTETVSRQNYNKARSFLTISSLSFLFFLSVFSLTMTRDEAKISEKTQLSNVQKAQQNKIAAENTENNSLSALEEDTAPLNQVFKDGSSENSSSPDIAEPTNFQLPIRSNSSEDIKNAKNYTGFASQPSCPTCSGENQVEDESVFDDKGNIKGEPAGGDLLATAVGTTAMNHLQNPSSQGVNPIILPGFISISLVSLAFIFRHQLSPAGNRTGTIRHENPAFKAKAINHKILEINQKTDGTVILSFKGVEFKVSKPELDSESDQFITRMMELVRNDVKEIDYDTLNDEKIRFNTPLSKLVTRLGFVGLKRDLFFPRTSKNRVLFRRYITNDDLIAMSLTAEEISSHL